MLVKLGSVWVDPEKIEFLEPTTSTIINIDGSTAEVSYVNIITTDRASQSGGDIDTFASIVNQSLSPKQSW